MKKIIPGGIAAALVAGGLLLTPAAASAEEVDSFGVCTPSEASTETIVHPAVGEPTLTIENPDYVPAVDAVPAQPAIGTPTIEITNPDYVAPTYTPGWTEHIPASYTPAEGEPTIDVEQDNPDYVAAVEEVAEVAHTDYHSKKYVVDVAGQDAVYEDRVTEREYKKLHPLHGWQYQWFPATANPGGWIATGEVRTESVKVQDAIEEQGHWEHQTTHEQPGADWTVTGTEKHITQAYVPGSPAQGEPTIWVTIENPDYVPASYTPAHDVEHAPVYTPPVGTPTIEAPNPDYVPATDEIPGTPAQGEPTIEVANPDYVAERTEVIEHAAVTCEVAAPDEEEPEPAPVTKAAAATDDADTLAKTGGSDIAGWGIAGLAMIAAGGTAVAIRRKLA